MANRKSSALVECNGVGIKRNGRVPKGAHHLHGAGIIPNIGRDNALRTRGSPHLADRFGLIGNKVDHQTRYGSIERMAREGQRLRVADSEARPRIGHGLAREGDKAVGRIDAGHLTWRCACKDDFAQGARAAAYIDPITARRHAEPVHELPGNETAPAADIGLIRVAAGPNIFSFRNHATSHVAAGLSEVGL